jgi:hypothetical protein
MTKERQQQRPRRRKKKKKKIEFRKEEADLLFSVEV